MTTIDLDKLVGKYRRAFKTPEGRAVISDLSVYVGLTPSPDRMESEGVLSNMAGPTLNHAECAYRNGQQDLVKYITEMIKD